MTEHRDRHAEQLEARQAAQAVLTALLDDTGLTDSHFTPLLEEFTVKYSGNGLKTMAGLGLVVARVLAQQHGVTDREVIDDILRHFKARGDTPELVDDLRPILEEVLRMPPDLTALDAAVENAGQRWHQYAIAEAAGFVTMAVTKVAENDGVRPLEVLQEVCATP